MVKSVFDMLVVVSSFRDLVPPFRVFSFSFSNRRILALNTGFEHWSEQSQLQKFLDAGGSHPAACAYRTEPNNIQITLGF